MLGFSKTHNPNSLPWPRLETLASVKQYLPFISGSGRTFTTVMCTSALLEGNKICHFLKLIYPPTFPLLESLISSHKPAEEVQKMLSYTSVTQHLPGTVSPSPQLCNPPLSCSFIQSRNIQRVYSAAMFWVLETQRRTRQMLLFSFWSLRSSEGESQCTCTMNGKETQQ